MHTITHMLYLVLYYKYNVTIFLVTYQFGPHRPVFQLNIWEFDPQHFHFRLEARLSHDLDVESLGLTRACFHDNTAKTAHSCLK